MSEQWRDHIEELEAQVERLRLSERELSAINFAANVVRGVEGDFAHTGIREGQATSDVLAGIVSRYALTGGNEE